MKRAGTTDDPAYQETMMVLYRLDSLTKKADNAYLF